MLTNIFKKKYWLLIIGISCLILIASKVPVDSYLDDFQSLSDNSGVIKVGFENHTPGTKYNKNAQYME